MDHDVFRLMIADRDRRIADLEFKLYSAEPPAPLVEVFEHGEDLVEFIERTAAENTKDMAAAKERWEAKYRGASLTPIKPWEDLDMMEKLKLMAQERDRREQAEGSSPPHAVAAAQAQDAIKQQLKHLWYVCDELAGLQPAHVIDKARGIIMTACASLKEAANALDAG